MANVQIKFTRCVQDSQEYGSDDQHMVSRIFFSMNVDGRKISDLYCDVKQTVGSDYEKEPIEVSGPKGKSYRGPFDQQKFSAAVEQHYRLCVGSGASGIRLAPGAKGIRMQNNIIIVGGQAEFEAHGPDAAW